MKKYYPYILIIVLVLVLSLGYFIDRKNIDLTKTNNFPVLTSKLIVPTQKNNESMPNSATINNVPFQSQAPFGNWDQLHDEACEEAVITVAAYYSTGQNLTPQAMENEIQKMVAWENSFFGSNKDLTATETAEMAQKLYGLNFKIQPITSINDIKTEIAQNHLVIVPTAGRLLGNPYYRSPGPIYHMLVISGYNNDQIITQDVGTKHGQNYIYDEQILFNAIHDWSGAPDNILSGQKVMLVLS